MSTWNMIVQVIKENSIPLLDVVQLPLTLKTTYRTGCRNVSHYQQQSSSEVQSPERSCSTYL